MKITNPLTGRLSCCKMKAAENLLPAGGKDGAVSTEKKYHVREIFKGIKHEKNIEEENTGYVVFKRKHPWIS